MIFIEEFQHLSPTIRQRAIIEVFRQVRNMAETGKMFGITRERVRQIVVSYEQSTNDYIERVYLPGTPRDRERNSAGCVG